jgi:hypothetical protein
MMKRIVSLMIASALVASHGAAFSNTKPEEQLNAPKPPVTGVGGYSGVYYDDQASLQRAFTFLEAWTGTSDKHSERNPVICTSVDVEPCKSESKLAFDTPLPKCSAERTRDCVEEFALSVKGGEFIQATFIEEITPYFFRPAPNEFMTPFKGEPSRGIPDSGLPSLWRFAGVKHAGGDEFLLIPKVNGEIVANGRRVQNLDVGIFPVSKSTTISDECFIKTSESSCVIRWPFPDESKFRVKLKTGLNLVGWFYGRLTDPIISSEKLTDGQNSVSISGAPISVPAVGLWKKNSELPQALNDSLDKEFESRGNQFAGTCYFGCSTKSRAEQAVLDERNPSFDINDYFDRYLIWVKLADDRAYANRSTWSFRTVREYGQYEKCLSTGGIAGIVTTNSNAYIAGPPNFDGVELNYRVASPHFDSQGKLQIGTYDLAIRSDVARCLYSFTDAPVQASLSIVYADGGEGQKATTVVNEKGGWLTLSAKGFTYSSPTVKVKLTQDKPVVATPTPSPSASPTVSPTTSKQTSTASSVVKKKSITCVKGATSKKVVAVNPKCPKGYKKI